MGISYYTQSVAITMLNTNNAIESDTKAILFNFATITDVENENEIKAWLELTRNSVKYILFYGFQKNR